MRTTQPYKATRKAEQGFTLPELLVAMVASMALTGTAFLLLINTVYEQRNGLADTAVEEQAYLLRANLTKCLRGASANMGFTPDRTTLLPDGVSYTSIFVFAPSNGVYVTGNINYNAVNGTVIYTPDVTTPWVQSVWMTNTPTAVLTQLFFKTSLNIDGSQNNTLANVTFAMNDNGFSQQGSINNPTSIYRNFSVQLRNDY